MDEQMFFEIQRLEKANERLSALVDLADAVRCQWVMEHGQVYPDTPLGAALGQFEVALCNYAQSRNVNVPFADLEDGQ